MEQRMSNSGIGTEEAIEQIHEIVDFAMNRLQQNGQILVDASDGGLFSFFEEESLADEVHNWCVVNVSLCPEHGASLQTRGPVLSAKGFVPKASTNSTLEFEAEMPFDDCYSTLYALLVVGVDAGETQLEKIELTSVNSERSFLGLEKYEFFSSDSEGGD
jgi:hypothetical protein